MNGLTHVHVETAQDFLATIKKRRLNAEAVEYPGKFDRNIAAAGDDDLFGKIGHVEGLVGGNDMLTARQVRVHIRRSPDGDQNVFGCHRLAGRQQADRIGAFHDGTAVMQFHIAAFQIAPVNAFEPGDFLVLRRHQLFPGKGPFPDGPAEALGILEFLGKFRGIDKQFLRHASADHAGAAVAIFLSDSDLGTMGRGNPCGAHTARSTADHKQVVVKIAHRYLVIPPKPCPVVSYPLAAVPALSPPRNVGFPTAKTRPLRRP